MTRKLGVALGAGASWGFASLGVLQALEEHNIKIDYLSGSSMGSILAVSYACGFAKEETLREIQKIFRDIKVRHLLHFSKDHPFGISSHHKRQEYFEKILGKLDFEDLKIPVCVVATDFRTGEEVVFDKGPIIPAILASSTFPIMFTPFEYQGKLLADGGLSNPTPVDAVRKMGADVVIGVDITSKQHLQRLKTQERWHHKIPLLRFATTRHLGKTTVQILDLLFSNLNRNKIVQYPPDFLLTPDVTHHGQFDFKKIDVIVKEGYQDTLKILPDLKRLLDNE